LWWARKADIFLHLSTPFPALEGNRAKMKAALTPPLLRQHSAARRKHDKVHSLFVLFLSCGLSVALPFVAGGCAPSLDLTRIAPASAGFDAARLDAIHAHLARAVSERRIPGAVALVARDGRVAYVDTVGAADVEKSTPMAPDTIFRIANMTKPITSAAAMILVDDGVLKLSDPVSNYIPEFKDPLVLVGDGQDADGRPRSKTVRARREVLVQDLLTHTSGIAYGFSASPRLAELYAKAGVTDGLTQAEGDLAGHIARLGQLPLENQPGEAWKYGLSIDVLGRVIEVASMKPLDRFLEQRIFKPLGMVDTHFFLPPEKVQRLAALYALGDDRMFRRVGEEPVTAGSVVYSASCPYKGPKSYFSGGAGLVSTARDYLRFLQMLLNRGELDGTRILKPETVDHMCKNQIGDLPYGPVHGDKFGFGFGVVVNPSKEKEAAPVGTISWGGIYNTYFWVDPKNRIIGLLLMQLYPEGSLTIREDFMDLVYKAFESRT